MLHAGIVDSQRSGMIHCTRSSACGKIGTVSLFVQGIILECIDVYLEFGTAIISFEVILAAEPGAIKG